MKFYILILLLIGIASAGNVVQVNDKNFKLEVVESGKYCLVEFYADWCRHCTKLSPIYEELADLYAGVEEVSVMKINGDKDGKRMVKKYDIPGFPMIRMFHGEEVIDYEGSRDLESLSNFIQQVSGVRLETKPYISSIKKLHDLNFQSEVLDNKVPSFIYFTKEKNCVKCTKSDLIFEKLSNVYANDNSSIQFGKVLVDESPSEKLIKQFGIYKYPQLFIFDSNRIVDGYRRPELYEGNFDIESIIGYLNKNFALHRDKKGRLLPSAGRIEIIDEYLERNYSGSSSIDFLQNFNNIIDKRVTNDKMIIYYKKLINKIMNGEEIYFEKELERLQRMLGNSSNLKSTSIDSIEKRINVLKFFTKLTN